MSTALEHDDAAREPVAVILPAAGSGSRMHEPGRPSKQFRTLGGEPLLIQTVRVFDRHPQVQRIVIAVPESEVGAVAEALIVASIETDWDVVAGGATRQASVGEGLRAVLNALADPLVLVHDAVRPFLGRDRLDAVIEVARRTGAAALAVPVADTVRRGDGGLFTETVPRDALWRMQTPQAVRASLLAEAHERFRDVPGTDEVELVRRAGHPVSIVEGSTLNVKITRPEDWAYAEAVWPWWSAQSAN